MNDYTLMNREFWQLLKEEKATTFGGVPYIYEMLKKLRFERMDLPSLHYITQAGGKLSKELAEEFYTICAKKNIKLIVMYGQTEATARMSYLPWEKAQEKAGSMGIAIPGGTFELRDDNGNAIHEADMVGELVFKGDNVTLGYAESYSDLCKEDESNGILFTGDMAKVDQDGFYYIVGRKKRFLKIFGNRVNLDEIEGLLKKEGYECVCGGIDDQMKIYALEYSKEDEIKAFIIGITHLPKSAFQIIHIDEIPRNEAGKILYSKLPQ
jgi:acyl-coenzyme A synthetase/AMP-(fatty) acid ligase